MKKIKSFIYLDNNKMYSISSQLFEGLTEYVVNSETRRESEKDEQKGKLGTGRLMADIIENETGRSEKKFLHHYSYNLFEEELLKENKVLVINPDNINVSINSLENYNFIKVTNKVGFNDSKIIEQTLTDFNELGEAMAFAGHSHEIEDLEKQGAELLAPLKDRNQRHKVKSVIGRGLNLKELAKNLNMYIDPRMLDSLKKILQYGYNQSFEMQLPFVTDNAYYLFSALLNRELLVESELSIIKKFSRETEKEFTLFGMLTQVQTLKEKVSLYKNAVDRIAAKGEPNMKEATMNLISSITNVEASFVGKLDYEYIIDPIAVYREI